MIAQAKLSEIESTAFGMLAAMQTIGSRIKLVRGLVPRRTQLEFAALLGVTRGAVGNWERNQGIKRENLVLISKKTRVSVDWLSTGAGSPPNAISQAPERTLGWLAQADTEPTDSPHNRGLDDRLLVSLAEMAIDFALAGLRQTADPLEISAWAKSAVRSFSNLQGGPDRPGREERQTPPEGSGRKG